MEAVHGLLTVLYKHRTQRGTGYYTLGFGIKLDVVWYSRFDRRKWRQCPMWCGLFTTKKTRQLFAEVASLASSDGLHQKHTVLYFVLGLWGGMLLCQVWRWLQWAIGSQWAARAWSAGWFQLVLLVSLGEHPCKWSQLLRLWSCL